MAGEDARYLAEYVRTGSPEAFEKLALRYSKLVFAACMRRLGTRDEAEDASQAVFVILARQAHRVDSEHLASWLHRTAVRAASVAARSKARRARHEEEAARMRPIADSPAEPTWPETRQHLDAEIEALPPRLREAVSRHYLAGQSRTELARELGVPEGTVASRVSAGIERLRQRLARRGLLLSGAALGALLASEATLAVPASLLASLPHLATGVTAAGAAAGGAGSVSTIVEGVIKMLFWEKLKVVGVAVLAAGALAATTPVAIQALAGAGGGEAVQTGAVENVIRGKVTAVQGETVTIAAGKKDGVREGFEFGCKEKGWNGKVVLVAEDSATLKLTAETAKAAVGDFAQTGLTVVGTTVRPQDTSPGSTPAPPPAGPEAADGLQLTLTCKEFVVPKSVYVDREGKEVRAKTDAGFDDTKLPDGVVKKHLKISACELQAEIKNVSDKPIKFLADPAKLCGMQTRNPATGEVTKADRLQWHPEAVQDPKTGEVLPKEGAFRTGSFRNVALATAKPSPALETYAVTLQPGEMRTVARLTMGRKDDSLKITMVIDCELNKELAERYWHGRVVSKEVEWKNERREEVAAPQPAPGKPEPF